MVNETCSSDLMKQKLAELHAILLVTQRTLDSNDACIFQQEAIDLMSVAANAVQQCEQLRQRLDVEIYQQSSKYYSM